MNLAIHDFGALPPDGTAPPPSCGTVIKPKPCGQEPWFWSADAPGAAESVASIQRQVLEVGALSRLVPRRRRGEVFAVT